MKNTPKKGVRGYTLTVSLTRKCPFFNLPFAKKCEVTTSFEQQNQKPHKEDLRTVPFTIPFIRSPSSKHCAKEWVARAEWGLMTVMGLEAQISLQLTHSIRVSLCIQWASWAWNGIRRSVRLSLHMGQFLQGGKNGRLMSYFFLKVEPPCDQTWWDSLVFSILSCFSYVVHAENTLVGPVGPF